MLTEMMSRSVISSPPIDTAVSAATGIPLMRSPSPSTAGTGAGVVGIMMAQYTDPSLSAPGCLTGPTSMTRPMTLSGHAAGAHVPQNSGDSGLG